MGKGEGGGECERVEEVGMKKRYCSRVLLRVATMPPAACVNAFFVTWERSALTWFFFSTHVNQVLLVYGGQRALFF